MGESEEVGRRHWGPEYAPSYITDEARLLDSIDQRLARLVQILEKLEPLLKVADTLANGTKKEKVRVVLDARKHPKL